MAKIALFLHLLAALFWIGGMLFLTLVVAPFLLTIKDPVERSRIYQTVGTKYRFWGWVSIALLLVTGPLNLYYLWGITPSALLDTSTYGTDFGRALGLKLAFVAIIVLTSLVHDFLLGPRARTSPQYTSYARNLGRTNLVLALLIVILAVLLRTGGT